jgi:Na+-transporting NADH:ubiquinone oxidoreductase subunit NqrB
VLRKDWRWESSLITVLILLFVLRPTVEPAARRHRRRGLVASASKYLLVWQGRHIFNPAAVGATCSRC